jgi:hypothetical protein
MSIYEPYFFAAIDIDRVENAANTWNFAIKGIYPDYYQS